MCHIRSTGDATPSPFRGLADYTLPRFRSSFCEDRYAVTPNTVEIIPTLGALLPRDGLFEDPVLTRSIPCQRSVLGTPKSAHTRESGPESGLGFSQKRS